MVLPLWITTVSILRIPQASEYDEPYNGAGETDRDEVASGIHAVIDDPGGTTDVQGGQQNVADYGLKCDPVPAGIDYSDWIRDARDGRTYRIVWFIDFGDHIEARMRDTEGEV